MVFFGHFLGFDVFFCSLCFCAFALFKIAQNGYFPAFLEVFCLFCSHKRPVLKCFFLPILFFLLLSSLQKSIVLFAFCPSTPFYKRLFVGFLFFFFCLPFPFLRFACLFDTNLPNIPFLKPNSFSFLAVSFFLLLLFLFSLCMFQPFCFYVGFVYFFVLFCVLLLSSFLFCFQSMKQAVFLAILVFFFELCWLKG